ncbi:hypothetical protein ABMA70_04845 [Halobacteriovorax sp. XZX-3]|uniref:hypothetical protein n=1 Tax=unclassified Halobacteriovorax TaxID=2639665 RepID=UPI000CD30867|nr:hypothetical protein [Halobacteriovorax sp. DA5]POB15171.1 hypothetical protein C0Z22_01965 [Halobacteriovorax sp. DA5]
MNQLLINFKESKTLNELTEILDSGWQIYKSNALLYSSFTLGFSLLLWALSIIPFASGLLTPFFLASFYTAIIKSETKKEITIYDFIAIPKEKFNLIFISGSLSSLITFFGFILFILPGLYFFASYLFVMPLTLEKQNDKSSAWEILEESRKIFTNNYKIITAAVFVYIALALLGALALGLGLFITIPLITCINYQLYKKIK